MIAAIAALSAAAFAAQLVAEASTAARTFASEQYRYSVALPDGCRYEEGPGTVDAVCAADFDSERSAWAESATALVMEVGAEALAGNPSRTPSELAQSYSEAAFREELPQAVCGEAEPSRARVQNTRHTVEGNQVVYTADVICAEVKFLQIAERRASVRYVIRPDTQYRLIARAPIEAFEKHKSAIAAFFDSFRILAAENKAPQ